MSFQPTQAPRKARTSLVVAVASTVVVAIIAVVLLSRGGDDEDTAATSTTTASSDTSAVGTASSGAGPVVSGISPTSLPPISNGGPETVSGQVTITGTPLAQFPESGADKAVGQTFPDMSGVKVTDSSPLSITNDGRPKVVLFIAHWCPHCQKEVPLISQYLAQNGMPAGVDLYTVATSTNETRPNYPPNPWLVKEQWPVKTIADNEKNDAASAYGVTGFPYFVVVGADGKVITRTSGELTMAQFQQLIDQAKASAPATTGSTPAAR